MNITVKRAKSRNLFQLLQTREDQAHVSVPAIMGSITEGALSVQVWAVRKPDSRVKAWVAHIKKQLKTDKSWRTDGHYSRLAGNALRALKSTNFAHVDVDLSAGCIEEGDRPDSLYSCESAALIMVDASGTAIGYAVYGLKWCAARVKSGQHELEVEVEEVWIEPAYRKEGLGRYLASMLVNDVWEHLESLEKQLPSSANPTFFEVLYAGDTYSTSGEQFLELCSFEHEILLEEGDRLGNLEERSVSYEPRW